jgi:spore maturation protein CgeB
MIKKKIKLLIIGSEDNHLIENFYRKAFNFIGLKKVFFFSNKIYLNIFFFFKKIKLGFLFYPIQYLYYKKVSAFLKKNKKINVILIFKGIEIDARFLTQLKKKHSPIKIVNIYTDDPFNFSSISNSSSLVLNSIPEYDFFFIYSKKILTKLKSKYSFYKNFYYLPFGFDSRIKNFKKKKINTNYISFVGNADNHRKNIIKMIKKVKINIFGNLWDTSIENHSFNKPILNNDYFKILRKSFISINILRKQNIESNNMKTFEIPAQGTLMVTSRSPEQNLFFPENKACIMFGNARELENKILFLMKNKKLVKRIAKKGFEYSIKHSYTNRAKYILKVIYASDNV